MPHHEVGLSLLVSLRASETAPQVRASRSPLKAAWARDPEAVEDREQQKGVFRSFPASFCFFDQGARPLGRCYGFWSRVSFYLHQRVYQRYL